MILKVPLGFLARYSILFGFILSLFILGFIFLERIELISSYNADLGGTEPNIIYGIQRLMDDQTLYSDPNQPPYAIITYSPLYFHICATIGNAFDLDQNEPIEIYRLSRAISLLFNLGLTVFVFLIAYRIFNLSWMVSVISAIMSFLYLRITEFSRVDSLYHLILIGCIYLLLEYSICNNKKRGLQLLGVASALGMLSLFAKQSGLILLVLMVFFLIYTRDDLKNILFSLLTMLGSFLLFLLLFSQGSFYDLFQNTYNGVDNGVSIGDWFYRRILLFYAREINFFTAFVLALASFLLIEFKDKKNILLGLGIWATFSFGLLTTFKWGSMPSYFTPFICLGFIAISYFLTDILTNRYNVPKNFLHLFLLGIVIFCGFTELPKKLKDFRHEKNDKVYEEAREVYTYLNDTLNIQKDEWVFNLIAGQMFQDRTFLNNFLYRNALLPSKDIVTCCAYRLKSYDYKDLKEGADSGLIKYVIKKRASNLDSYFDMKFTRFHLVKEFNNYSLYQYSE